MSPITTAIFHRVSSRRLAVLAAIVVGSICGISAHGVRGLYGTAFVSSATPSGDKPIAISWTGSEGTVDTGRRVVCFSAANTSAARVDAPDWPRITAVGLEVPGSKRGFVLTEPVDGWRLVEGVEQVIPGRGAVTLDLAIVADVNLLGLLTGRPRELPGVPPGQLPQRGKGTRFCVSGPFPDTLPSPTNSALSVDTTIELLLNGVVVRFHGTQRHDLSADIGVWDNALRHVPLYPE